MRFTWTGTPAGRAAACRPNYYGFGHTGYRAPVGLDAWMDATLRDFGFFAGIGDAQEQRVRLRSVVVEQPDAWRVACEVPGVPREKIDVEVRDRRLVVTARRDLRAPEGFKRVAGDRRGTVGVAHFDLPSSADLDSVKATLVDGVLELTIARVAPPPRRSVNIEVRTSSSASPTPEPNNASQSQTTSTTSDTEEN